MSIKTVMKKYQVLSCFKKLKKNEKERDLWKINYLKEADFFDNLGKSFEDKIFKEATEILPFELKKGSNIVKINLDEDVLEEDGKIKLIRTVESVEIEDSSYRLDEHDTIYYEKDFPNLDFSKEKNLKVSKNLAEGKKISKSENFKFERSGLAYDMKVANGHLNNFNASDSKNRNQVERYLKKIGLEKTKDGINWVLYHNLEMGIKAHFSNYPMNNSSLPCSPSLRIEFTGHFFIRKNADETSNLILRYFTKNFGTVFSFSRIDIRQDIFGAKSIFDFFPDFRNTEKHYWSLRSKPIVTIHHNGCTNEVCGFTIKNNYTSLTVYDRILSMKEKFKKGKITLEYYNYYMKKSKGESVFRIEVRWLRKDACDFISKMSMHESYDKEKTLKYAMANYGRNHMLRDVGEEKRESRYKENDIFRELFYLEEKKNCKIFKTQLEEKAEIKIKDMVFNIKKRPVEHIMKTLAKSFCLLNSKEVISNTIDDLKNVKSLSELKKQMEKMIDIKDDTEDRLKKSLAFIDLNEKELMEARKNLNDGFTLGSSYL